jgi:hypothetical protein
MRKKKIILVAIFSMALSISAQDNYEKRVENNVNSYIERIEKTIELTKEEKTKLYNIKKVHTVDFWKVTADFKDKPELAEEKQKISKTYSKSIIETFGRKRGLEILKASRVKKED